MFVLLRQNLPSFLGMQADTEEKGNVPRDSPLISHPANVIQGHLSGFCTVKVIKEQLAPASQQQYW